MCSKYKICVIIIINDNNVNETNWQKELDTGVQISYLLHDPVGNHSRRA